GERVERRAAVDFPAEKRRTGAAVGVHDDPLAAIVHPERQRGPASIDELHAQKLRAVVRPFVDVSGADADVPERLELHVRDYPHTSRAVSTTSDSLRRSSSTVSGLPMKLLAKPHCGLRHSWLSGRYLEAS